jgi:hypothetical protein
VTRTKALVAGMATLLLTLYAISGHAGPAASPMLLAITAFVALTLTSAPRPR